MDIDVAFQYINSVPDVAAYVLVREDAREVYINHSTKLRTKLGEISDLILSGEFTRFEYFCISADPVYKLIMSEQVRLRYINSGYSIINQKAPFIRFKVRSTFNSTGDSILVYIETSRGYKEIVGVFGKAREADEFVEAYYGARWDGLPVYANNEETRKYWVYKQKHGGQSGIFVESNE